ncbi:Uncharacterised protein [Nocardia otitidiscaviarum]|uniref:Uncharacterized protein n=1 Tax=Nocardia otitidiscaviarum TaxID=1823 RepID=A0A379JHF8_9NOCA|nr:Uncharacterised protein [Nocardia otitidiscaviarum]
MAAVATVIDDRYQVLTDKQWELLELLLPPLCHRRHLGSGADRSAGFGRHHRQPGLGRLGRLHGRASSSARRRRGHRLGERAMNPPITRSDVPPGGLTSYSEKAGKPQLDPAQLYRTRTDTVRRHLNQTFFQRFYLDVGGVSRDQLHQPFADLHHAAGTRPACVRPAATPQSHADQKPKSGPTPTQVLKDPGSSKAAVVELPGIEPGQRQWWRDRIGFYLRKQITRDHTESPVFSRGCAQNVPTVAQVPERFPAALGIDPARGAWRSTPRWCEVRSRLRSGTD